MVNQVYVLVLSILLRRFQADSLRVSPEGIKTKEAEGSSNRELVSRPPLRFNRPSRHHSSCWSAVIDGAVECTVDVGTMLGRWCHITPENQNAFVHGIMQNPVLRPIVHANDITPRALSGPVTHYICY